MTSAPNQASISVHDVPASNCVRSRTRIPFRALLMMLSPVEGPSHPLTLFPEGREHRFVIVTEMALAPRIDFTLEASYDVDQVEARQDLPHVSIREEGLSCRETKMPPQRLPCYFK